MELERGGLSAVRTFSNGPELASIAVEAEEDNAGFSSPAPLAMAIPAGSGSSFVPSAFLRLLEVWSSEKFDLRRVLLLPERSLDMVE